MKNKILLKNLLFFISVFLISIMGGCGGGDQVPQDQIDPKYSSIWFVTEVHTGIPGDVNITVHFEHLSKQYIKGKLNFTYWTDGANPPSSPSSSISLDGSSNHGEVVFTMTDLSLGTYDYNAYMECTSGYDYPKLYTPPGSPIKLTITTGPQRNVFKICEIHMKNSESSSPPYLLWENFKSITVD